MNGRLFWKALAVQAVVLAVPFVILALALDRSFFEDWGWLTGPVVWLLASAVTARILSMPLGYALFSAARRRGGGRDRVLLASHAAGMVAACWCSRPPAGAMSRPRRAGEGQAVAGEEAGSR